MLRQRAITNILIFEIIGFGKIYQTLRTIFLKGGGGGVSLCFVFYLKDLTNPVISQIKHKKKKETKKHCLGFWRLLPIDQVRQ